MRAFFLTALCCALAVSALAANISGRWALGTGGRGGPTILTLSQVGDRVTGTISVRKDAGSSAPVNQDVVDGKVQGDVVTFYVWTGTDVPVKQMYKGTIVGDDITFEITGGPARGGGGFGGGAPGASGGRGGGQNAGRGAPAGPPVAHRVM